VTADDRIQDDRGQDEIFAFLADPATHGGIEVKRIDTHSAAVFLAGDRALKVKRAVRYPFLDFSTLDKRKAACETELQVNRLFAPDLYRRVIAVTRKSDGTLALAPPSDPPTAEGSVVVVEWAVEMRRFDETKTLDRLADDDAIDVALADALARTVAATHARVPAVAAPPWIEALASYIDQNEDAFRQNPELFDGAQAVALGRQSRAMLDRLRPLLKARGEQGLVRRGHGDLHLGNVVLIDARPVLFDAVEFSPLVAAGDVFYDLAFLLMDLVERGLVVAANVVLNRYLVETGRAADFDALAAMPLFVSLRAAIRAKVTASRAALAAPADHETAAANARRYFALACRLIRPPPAVLVGIGGLSGTGKSLLARSLAPGLEPAPGAVVLRSDVERKAMAGLAEHERLPAAAYTAENAARVYAELACKARRVIAAGHSAIVDAVFAREEERNALRAIAGAEGVAFHGLFLTADVATRLARIGTRQGDASDADAAVARAQQGYALGRIGWVALDASGAADTTLERAREFVLCVPRDGGCGG
jgi:aminoglycoside phosphotransferase family enzyme/predicted kinase